MIDSLKKEVARHGDKAAIVSIDRLQSIRQDLEDLQGSENLNNFQHYIVKELYHLDVPDAGFEVRSMILAATPVPSTIEMIFHMDGKRIPVIFPASYADKDTAPRRIEKYLKEYLEPSGYHILYAPRLPFKRLAVRSGLAAYGRNNICYVEGMGSFVNLSAFFSDIPCVEDEWQQVHQMGICRTCRACLENCPTGAIMPNRFLIDNERCLTYFNEAGSEWDFPAWIDPSSHNALYGCMRCQTVCPVDRPYLNAAIERAEFSEEETALLLEGKPFELFPEDLRQKVNRFDMMNYLGAVPRNLRALFNQVQ